MSYRPVIPNGIPMPHDPYGILPELQSEPERTYSNDLKAIPDDFLAFVESLETLVTKAAVAIDQAELQYFIPFHYNTIEVTIPSYHVQKFVPHVDADISILFSRTKFTEQYNLEYTYDNIVEFYKQAAITIGKHGSNRVYHINTKASYANGEHPYRCIQDNIKRLYSIHEKTQTFDITADEIYAISDDIVTIVNPTSSNFPRSFTL